MPTPATPAPATDAAAMMTAALEGRSTSGDDHLLPAKPAAAPTPTPTPTQDPAPEQNPIAALLGAQDTPQEQTTEQEQDEPGKPGRKPRTFDGLPEEFHQHLNNMNRQAYEFLYPLLKELLPLREHKDKLGKLPDIEKELNELRTSRWSDHPEAYRLTDEYRKTTDDMAVIGDIEQHFAAQLDALAQGAKEVEMLTIQNGELVPQKIEVGPQTQRILNAEYFAAQQRKSQLSQSLAALKEAHSGRWSTHTKSLEGLQKTLFGEYTKMLEEPAKAELAKFPAYFRSRPEASLLANAIALVTLGGKAMQKMLAERSAVTANKTAATQAPPTRDGVSPTPGNGKLANGGYSMEEYKTLKSQGMLG